MKNVGLRITDEEYNAQEYVFVGCDFGFAGDPAAVIRLSYDRKSETIMIMDEIYKRGLSNKALSDMIFERGLNTWGDVQGYYSRLTGEWINPEQLRIICDSASPKDIADLRSLGLSAVACHKEPGCVMYRLKWLQSRKIVIDPARCPNAAREFQNYCYNIDKRSGEILSSVPDADNHTLDSTAYALDRQIYQFRNPA